jgi:glycosyltransferase involved in cell wall biosynthesis
MPKLVAQLRVKDAILFIEEWLERMNSLVDEIVVVDNGSTDGTLEILQKHPKVVSIKQTFGFDEGRDKQLLYQLARERKPDWNIWLDADEIFEDRITRKSIERLMSSKRVKIWLFRRNDMYKDHKHFAVTFSNIIHIVSPSRTLWKEQESAFFGNTYVHDGDIKGVKGFKWVSKYRIKHVPMLYRDYRIAKCKHAIEIDPANKKIYERDMDSAIRQHFPTWRWYEWNENPFMIFMQNTLFNFIYFNYQIFYRQTFHKLIKKSLK